MVTGSEFAAIAAGERKTIRALCKAALDKGFTLSYNDGEAWPVKKTDNIAKIMAHVQGTDEAMLMITDKDGKKIASFFLVYGNAPDEVIADYSYPAENEGIANSLWDASNIWAKIQFLTAAI
jgi:hypothetical protein